MLMQIIRLLWVNISVRMPMNKKELAPALESIEEVTGRLPDKLSMDNGYMSGDNLQTVQTKAVDTYIATDKSEKKK